jgi:hypothetical protein
MINSICYAGKIKGHQYPGDVVFNWLCDLGLNVNVYSLETLEGKLQPWKEKGKLVFHGFLSKDELISEYLKYDLFLIIVGDTRNCFKWIIPAKMAELAALERRVLVISPQDSAVSRLAYALKGFCQVDIEKIKSEDFVFSLDEADFERGDHYSDIFKTSGEMSRDYLNEIKALLKSG